MIDTRCPSRDQLLEYAVGKLPDEASEDLVAHVHSCTECQAELATLDDADDTLVANLRGPAVPEPFLQESECEAALARAMSLGAVPMTESDESSHSWQGKELGEYRLLEPLGSGGMGTVYRAVHTKLDRVVAVKVLSNSRIGDERSRARFEREMKAIGRLDHPNIVQAHDAREFDAMPVLIMECVEGMDLAELVRRLGQIRMADACELICRTALALQCAHEHGMVHRDMKPSNIMLSNRGEVKLLDLGLARLQLPTPDHAEMTGTNQAMGTADYMAPEQVADSRTVDIRSDIYSLGCTLYKLLSGQAPFSGPQYRNAFEKMTAHVSKPVPPIQGIVADIPSKLRAVLAKMLDKDPQKRVATPAEVAATLEPFCSGSDLTALAQRAAAAERMKSHHKPTQPVGKDAENIEPQPRSILGRRISLATATGLMLVSAVVGLALGVIITVRHNGKQTSIEVPDGSRVKIDRQARVEVTLPDATEIQPTVAPPTVPRSGDAAMFMDMGPDDAVDRGMMMSGVRDPELPAAAPAAAAGAKPTPLVVEERRSMLRGLFDAVGSARSAASKSKSENHLKRIGLAMHMYHDVYKSFPPAYSTNAKGEPLLSWRVLILPYLEEAELFNQFHLEEFADSTHNRQLLGKMPEVFRSPVAPPESTDASFFVFGGADTPFVGQTPIRIRDTRDGTSNTLMVVETKLNVPWTAPGDIPYDPKQPVQTLGGFYDDGFHAVLCDGSVRFLPKDIAEDTLRNLITRSDGHPIPRSLFR